MDRLLASIEASRARPFGTVLFAIGIEGVGYVTGRSLAQHFRTVDALLAATPEQIAETPGIGPIVARAHPLASSDELRPLIDELRGVLRFEEEGPPPGEGPLAGKTFVLTGTLPGPHARGGDGADHRARAARSRAASPRRRATWWRAPRPAPSSRRPSGSASRVLDETRTAGAAGFQRIGWRAVASGTDATRLTGKEPHPNVILSSAPPRSASLALALAVPCWGHSGSEKAQAHGRPSIRLTRCRRRRRRTSTASAARASRRRRSASARRAARPRTVSGTGDLLLLRRHPHAVFSIKQLDAKTVTVPAPPVTSGRPGRARPGAQGLPPHAAAQQRRRVQVRRRRLDRRLRRHHPLQDRPGPRCAPRRRPTRSPANVDKGTVTISSGDNFLAGLNLRASFQRFDSGARPVLRLGRDRRPRLRRGDDRQPRVRLRPGPARRSSSPSSAAASPFLTANTDFAGEPLLQALRDNGRIADSTVVEKGGQKIGIIGVSPPETPSISPRATSSSSTTSPGSSTPRRSA